MGLMAAIIFLIKSLFQFYISCIILRILLQYVQINYTHPIAQFLCKLTDPAILPVRKLLPRTPRIDLAACLVAYLLSFGKLCLVVLLSSHNLLLFSLLWWACYALLSQVLDVFFFTLIFTMLLSWLPQLQRHPVSDVLFRLSEPLLMPIRRVIPPIAGFDLSALFALLGIKVIEIILPSLFIFIASLAG
jgi:YggT family protein